jgi:hypothetical protein
VNESCATSKRGHGAGQTIIEILADQIGGRLERHVNGTRVAVGVFVPLISASGDNLADPDDSGR